MTIYVMKVINNFITDKMVVVVCLHTLNLESYSAILDWNTLNVGSNYVMQNGSVPARFKVTELHQYHVEWNN